MVWYQMNEQQAKAINEIEESKSERIVAIVGGALLDQSLYLTIEQRMRPDPDGFRKMFRPNGPLAGAHKVDLAYLIYMVEKDMRDAMLAISDIRNLFAHNLSMSFDWKADGRMTAAMDKLVLHGSRESFPSPFWEGDSDHPMDKVTDNRSRFIVNLKIALIWIGGDSMRHIPHSTKPSDSNQRPQIFAPPGAKTFEQPT